MGKGKGEDVKGICLGYTVRREKRQEGEGDGWDCGGGKKMDSD